MFGSISVGKSTGSNSNRDTCKVAWSVTDNRGVRTDFDSSDRVCSVSNESSGSGANFPSGSDRDHPSGRSYSSSVSGVGGSSSYSSSRDTVQALSHIPQVPSSDQSFQEFNTRNNLQSLGVRSNLGTMYTLNYDQHGNLLSGDKVRDKYESYLKNNPNPQPQNSDRRLEEKLKKYDSFEQFKDEAREVLNQKNSENYRLPIKTEEITLSDDRKKVDLRRREAQKKQEFNDLKKEIEDSWADCTPEEKVYKNASISKDYMIKRGLIAPRVEEKACGTMEQSEDKIDAQERDSNTPSQELFDGGIYEFISNLEKMNKLGVKQDKELKVINFTHGIEGTRFCSRKEADSEQLHDEFGFSGVKVNFPIRDQDITKVIPYLSKLTLDYLCITNSKMTNVGLVTLTNSSLNIKKLCLPNNNIEDTGAKTISDALTSGKLPSTKEIDLHGNSITKTGYGYFVEALENTNTQDVTITLASTVKDMQKVGNEAMKAMYDFVVKGLRYAVQEHVKNNAGTKWDINKVRSNQEIDKWKDCKDTVSNIGMGYLAGLVKCASTSPSKDPYSMFVCSTTQGGWKGIAKPATLYCIADLNKLIAPAEDIDQFTTLVGETHDGCEIM